MQFGTCFRKQKELNIEQMELEDDYSIQCPETAENDDPIAGDEQQNDLAAEIEPEGFTVIGCVKPKWLPMV